MKKSQVLNNIKKPNRLIEGRSNQSFFWFENNANGIYLPPRKKFKR